MKQRKILLAARLPVDLFAEVHLLGKNTGKSKTQIVIDAIAEYMAKNLNHNASKDSTSAMTENNSLASM